MRAASPPETRVIQNQNARCHSMKCCSDVFSDLCSPHEAGRIFWHLSLSVAYPDVQESRALEYSLGLWGHRDKCVVWGHVQ